MNTRPKTFLLILIAAVLTAGMNPLQVWAEKNVVQPGPASLEARIKRLEDREEIRKLIMDYGRFLDQRDFKSFSELFAKIEGEWIGGMGRAGDRKPFAS